MDVARYSDTKGYVFQEERYPFAYTYRDYVVRSLNEDKPFDRFLMEQIAADRLVAAKEAEPTSLAALGYLTLGRRFLNVREDIIDDRIDVVARGMLGLTVGCARCHDHKFDPIPSEDYYSLFGVFASSIEPNDLPEIPASVPAELSRDFQVKIAEKQKALDAFLDVKRKEIQADLTSHLKDYLRAAVDLKMEARGAKVDERAKADKLASGRLRGVMFRWKTHLDATRGQPDPVMSAWHAFAALPEAGFAAKAPALAKSFVEKPDPARPVNPVLARAFAENPPKSLADVAARYGELLDQAGAGETPKDGPGWQELSQFVRSTTGPLAVTNETVPRWLDRAERNRYSTLNNAVMAVRASHPGSPPRAMVLVDAPQPTEPRVLLRGNPGRPGKAVPRRFLKVASVSERKPFTQGSGRLELARAIASPQNPLTARVFTNRVWLQHFGGGWSPRRATSACGATRRAAPNCSTGSRPTSWRTAGPSNICTARSCSRRPTDSGATCGPNASRRTPTTAWSGGSTAGGWSSRRCETACSPSPVLWIRRSAAGRSRSSTPRSRLGGRSTARLTGRTLTACTGRSTSPAPIRAARGGSSRRSRNRPSSS
ncbi:MAG: DUF1549 domain-containing protein [Isosphaeraceae bacterium]